MESTAPVWTGGVRAMRLCAIAAVLALAAWCVGLWLNLRQALFSFLIAYAFLASVLLGALIFLMAMHAARSRWPVAIRRLVEGMVGVLPLLVVLFVPIAVGIRHIYVWDGAERTTRSMRETIAHQAPYLNAPFFIVRAAIYLASWVIPAFFLRRWSLAQDRDGDPRWNHKLWALSGGGRVLLALTLTFASFDWFMSLTPDWKSSIYGVYFFAGGFLSSFAVLIILMTIARRSALAGIVKPGHFLSTGKYMLAFTIFWTYSAYSQFFIIWIADIPAEASWWVPRMHGWAGVSILLAVMQFCVPFAMLLMRDIKRMPRVMTGLAIWILAAHYLDMYWLVAPALHEDAPHPSWLDPVALILVVASAVAVGIAGSRGHTLVPAADPRFRVSAAYEGS